MADDTQHSEAGASAPDAPRTPRTPRTPVRQPEPADGEAALRRELAGVRGINEAVEGILATLGRAGGNMEVRNAPRAARPARLTARPRRRRW